MKKLQAILSLILILTLLTGCAVSAAMPEETGAALPPAAPERLTPEEARDIALGDADMTVDAVTRLRTEFEIDDGIPEYEIEFRSGDYEYDYTIHAETGAVRSRSKEFDPPAVPAAEPPPQATQPVLEVPTQPPADGKITADRAVDIALTHAGLSRADVTWLEAEFDIDDGVAKYDVEFHHGRMEYSFEIHAETGKILDFDRDA